MKIVCDSCGAKYSIADEKVAGKVFKIRCKRCSEVIVVRGDQEAAAEAAAPAVAADAIWHVVVDGEQQGPMTPADLGVMLSEGTIDWESFVWTEGFDNWAAMRDVEDLVAQITGGAEGEAQAESPTTTAAGGFGAVASDAFAGEASMGADPFADDEPTVAASDDLFASAASSAAAPAAAASPLIGGGAATASAAPSPRVSEEQAMTGVRNENSVLFSLKNLQALATGSSTPSVNPSMSAPGQQQAGMAGGEGSGLIDIRALASAAGAGGAAASSAASTSSSDKDDLLSLGGQAGGLGALSSPLMAPAPEEREGGGKGLLIASILGGAVLVAGGLVAFGMMNRQDPQPAAAVAPVAPAAAAAAVPGVQPADPASDTAKEKVAEEAAEKKVDEPDEADEAGDEGDDDKKAERSAAREKRRKAAVARKRSSSSSSGSSSSAAKPAAEPDPAPAPKPRRKSSANASIDDLLNNALSGGGSSKKAAAAPAPSNLPEKPSRDDVLSAMNGVKGAVSACNDGSGGVAVANITVKGSTGRVTNATIEGKTGAVGSCVAKAVRRARFPKFQSSTFKVKFPFRL